MIFSNHFPLLEALRRCWTICLHVTRWELIPSVIIIVPLTLLLRGSQEWSFWSDACNTRLGNLESASVNGICQMHPMFLLIVMENDCRAEKSVVISGWYYFLLASQLREEQQSTDSYISYISCHINCIYNSI